MRNIQKNKYLKWWPLYLGIVVLILTSLSLFYIRDSTTQSEFKSTQIESRKTQIGDLDYILEVVTNTKDHQKGLSGRINLAPQHGLLFAFPEPGDYGIWMKDMNFAIDIIWLDENQGVIGLAENIQPESYPEIFYADSYSLFIIEINAGEIVETGLKLGDWIQLPPVQL